MTPVKQIAPVTRTVTVNVPQTHAFSVFTDGIAKWWPFQSHKVGKQAAETVIMEPRASGRWFERAADGTECMWGHVLAWDPPQRLLLAWEINAAWESDPSCRSEVEVRFIAEGPRTTRVELEHRNLEAYGEKAEMVRSMIDSDGGWTSIIQLYVDAANSTAEPR